MNYENTMKITATIMCVAFISGAITMGYLGLKGYGWLILGAILVSLISSSDSTETES